eukprot:gene16154-biopygen14309
MLNHTSDECNPGCVLPGHTANGSAFQLNCITDQWGGALFRADTTVHCLPNPWGHRTLALAWCGHGAGMARDPCTQGAVQGSGGTQASFDPASFDHWEVHST